MPSLGSDSTYPRCTVFRSHLYQLPYDVPADLVTAVAAFVHYYNFHRYHQALGDVIPADVLHGRREQILLQRKEVRRQTNEHRQHYNRALRELPTPA